MSATDALRNKGSAGSVGSVTHLALITQIDKTHLTPFKPRQQWAQTCESPSCFQGTFPPVLAEQNWAMWVVGLFSPNWTEVCFLTWSCYVLNDVFVKLLKNRFEGLEGKFWVLIALLAKCCSLFEPTFMQIEACILSLLLMKTSVLGEAAWLSSAFSIDSKPVLDDFSLATSVEGWCAAVGWFGFIFSISSAFFSRRQRWKLKNWGRLPFVLPVWVQNRDRNTISGRTRWWEERSAFLIEVNVPWFNSLCILNWNTVFFAPAFLRCKYYLGKMKVQFLLLIGVQFPCKCSLT